MGKKKVGGHSFCRFLTAQKWPSGYDCLRNDSQIADQKNGNSPLKPRSHCPGVRPSASRQFAACGLGQTGRNREGIWVRSYTPGRATDQTRFRAKIEHSLSRLCYSFRRCIPGVAPEALRCVPMRLDTPLLCPGNRRHSLGVTTTRHGSRREKPRCYTVAYDYQWNFRVTYNIYVICKV